MTRARDVPKIIGKLKKYIFTRTRFKIASVQATSLILIVIIDVILWFLFDLDTSRQISRDRAVNASGKVSLVSVRRIRV